MLLTWSFPRRDSNPNSAFRPFVWTSLLKTSPRGKRPSWDRHTETNTLHRRPPPLRIRSRPLNSLWSSLSEHIATDSWSHQFHVTLLLKVAVSHLRNCKLKSDESGEMHDCGWNFSDVKIFSLDNFCVCAKEKFDERRCVGGIRYFIFGFGDICILNVVVP